MRKLSQQERRNKDTRDLSSTKNLRGNSVKSIKFLSWFALGRNRDTLVSDSGNEKISMGEK